MNFWVINIPGIPWPAGECQCLFPANIRVYHVPPETRVAYLLRLPYYSGKINCVTEGWNRLKSIALFISGVGHRLYEIESVKRLVEGPNLVLEHRSFDTLFSLVVSGRWSALPLVQYYLFYVVQRPLTPLKGLIFHPNDSRLQSEFRAFQEETRPKYDHRDRNMKTSEVEYSYEVTVWGLKFLWNNNKTYLTFSFH